MHDRHVLWNPDRANQFLSQLQRQSAAGSAPPSVAANPFSPWTKWSHSFRTWLVFAESDFEVDLGSVEEHLDGPVDLTMATPGAAPVSSRDLPGPFSRKKKCLQHFTNRLLRKYRMDDIFPNC